MIRIQQGRWRARVFAGLWIGLLAVPAALVHAEGTPAPWGSAAPVEQDYAGLKAVYDVTAATPEALEDVLDHAAYLSRMTGDDPFDSHIVLVIHGDALDLFAREYFAEHETLMTRARGLTLNGVIEYRICQAGAARRGYAPEDFHGFASVVPMADAEIVRLQQQDGYGYMR